MHDRRDDRLAQFFGGHFHQDWDVEGAASWRDVITHYAASVPPPHLTALKEDLVDWLREADNEHSDNLPPSFGCDYSPRCDGLTEREWVRQLIDEVDRLGRR